MDPLHIALAASTGALGLGGLLGLWWQHHLHARRARARDEVHSALSEDLRTARDQLDQCHARYQERREVALRLDQRLKNADRLLQEARAEADTLQKTYSASRDAVTRGEARIAVLEANVAELRQARDRAADALEESERHRERALHDVGRKHDQALAREQRRRQRAERVLAALDVDLPQQRTAPLDMDHRRRSRQHVLDLLASTGASAAALVDRRGFALLGAGPDGLIRRLGRLSGVGDPALEAVELALRAPVRHLSAVYGSGGLHLHRLGPDEGRWVGVAGPAHSPDLALRIATARLTGDLAEVAPPSAPVALAGPPPARGRADDRDFLADWSARWKAVGVVLVDTDGEVIASSDPGWDAALSQVGQALRGWFRRLDRADEDLDDADLRLGSYAGGWMVARVVDGDPDGLMAVAMADTVLPPEAMDELRGAARWHRLAPSSSATSPQVTA